MKSPEHITAEQMNELWDRYIAPLNAETTLSDKPAACIDLTKHPDLKPVWNSTPAGWMCVDTNRYDGPGSAVGWGETKLMALVDLVEQLEADDERPNR